MTAFVAQQLSMKVEALERFDAACFACTWVERDHSEQHARLLAYDHNADKHEHADVEVITPDMQSFTLTRTTSAIAVADEAMKRDRFYRRHTTYAVAIQVAGIVIIAIEPRGFLSGITVGVYAFLLTCALVPTARRWGEARAEARGLGGSSAS